MITFRQYFLPAGRKKDITIERSEPVETKAQALIAAGYRFESEILPDGTVSLTIVDPKDSEDVAMVLTDNDEGLINRAVDKLILSFDPPES